MNQNKNLFSIILAMMCGVLSFAIEFALLPACSSFIPSDLFTELQVFLPTILGAALLWAVGHCQPVFAFAGAPIQYCLLILFAEELGIIIEGWNAILPLLVSLVQFCTVFCLTKTNKRG